MTGRIVLAVDTATDVVAVGTGRRTLGDLAVLRSQAVLSPRRANSLLLQTVQEQLGSCELDITDVDEIVVGLGPGSFTGVRIGVATAKGVAQGLGVALYGVGSLDSIAWHVWRDRAPQAGALIGVVGDAMRGEVYPALFRVAPWGPQRLGDDTVMKPEALARLWARELDEPLILAGNALAKYADILAAALGERAELAPESTWAPDGASLLEAFEDARARGEQGAGDPGAVLPIYTRLSDAEETERARASEAGSASAVGEQAACVGETLVKATRATALPRLRALREADIDALLEIESTSFSDPWNRAMFSEELSAPGRAWIVAEDGGCVVGYAGIAVLVDEAHLMNIAVRQDLRGAGLGNRLLQRAIELAVESGASALTLEVRASNGAAIALYESAGLRIEGVRRRYYADTGEDGLVMTLDLAMTDEPGSRQTEAPAEMMLAIETSCDETAAAIMQGADTLLANVVASQIDFHARFGGVVPEIASRKHTEAIVGVVEQAMESAGRAAGLEGPLAFADLRGIAVTHGPGLVGALVVGLAYAKGLSLATGLPLVGVNHLEGHIFANVLADPLVRPPLVALVVSGGHTSLVHMPDWGVYRTLGQTLDDAAGEAFDKVAKVLGLGYPGGPVLSRLASEGDPAAIDFPRAMMRSGDFAFSLSGLKTAVINHIRHEREAGREIHVPDLAASFQAAVVDVQVAKATRAVRETQSRSFCLAGGVAANPALREALRAAIEPLGVHVSVPPFHLCTDNAAMIAAAAQYRFARGERLGLDAEAIPALRLDS